MLSILYSFYLQFGYIIIIFFFLRRLELDEWISFCPQMGLDEEVRQLLDLKGLSAQRDLGQLKDKVKPADLTAPAAATTAADGKDHSGKEP